MIRQDEYQVSLDAFHGPLDLLLYLIRRAEVDIHDIPIATVTDQYLSCLNEIERIDIDLAGEFLVMAATLIEIKSKLLMPADQPAGDQDDQPAAKSGEASDPRYELVQQLLAYQKYRTAGEELEKRRREFMQRFAAQPTKAQRERDQSMSEPVELDLDDVHALDLSEAYERIMAAIDLSRLGDHTVEIDDTPIALHQEDLLDRLQRSHDGRLTLQEAFSGQNTGQRVGMFLATLELVRMRRLTVRQDEVTDPIELILRDDDEAEPNDARSAPPEEAAEAPTEDARSSSEDAS